MVFSRSYFHRVHSSLYTLYQTTNIDYQGHHIKVVLRPLGSSIKELNYIVQMMVVIHKGGQSQFDIILIPIEPLSNNIGLE